MKKKILTINYDKFIKTIVKYFKMISTIQK